MKKSFLFYALLLALGISSCNGQEQQTQQSENDTINMNKDFLTLAAERYSVRKYSSTPVEQEKIDKILEAGKLAPTAMNSQPQMVFVLKSDSAVAKANKISPCIFGAPHAFLICYDDKRACQLGEQGNCGDIDCSIVLTHMMLEAWNLGVGTCMVGMFKPEDAVREFNLPSNLHPLLLMPFGYPAEDAAPSPSHSEYRPMEEMVKEL